MPVPATVAELTALGRVRLSEHLVMRDMLDSAGDRTAFYPGFPGPAS